MPVAVASNLRLLLATLLFAVVADLLLYPVLSLALTSLELHMAFGPNDWKSRTSLGS